MQKKHSDLFKKQHGDTDELNLKNLINLVGACKNVLMISCTNQVGEICWPWFNRRMNAAIKKKQLDGNLYIPPSELFW